jgi:hypothetical protein
MVSLVAEYYSEAKSSQGFIPPIDKILAISKDAFGDTFIPPIPHNPLENKMASILSGVDVSNLKGVVPATSINASATTGFNAKNLNNKDIGIG